MKNLINNLLTATLVGVLSLFAINVNAQFCSDFGEGDFMDLCVQQLGNGSTGPMMSNTLDIYDASSGGAGSDGVADVQLTLEAVVCNAGCGSGGPYVIEGCIGAATVSVGTGTSSDLGGDFNPSNSGTPTTTCEDAAGYVCITIDFLNGFNTTAMGFDFAQSSNNGTSESYEGSFGYVTAATDAMGNPITLPTVNLGDMCTYTNALYVAGTQMSTHVGATGPGTYQTDELNAITNDCATSGQNGEDTDSGSGGTDGDSAQTAQANLGLNPTDIITQVKHVYFISVSAGSDCDGNGTVGSQSDPSGSWSDIDFCFDPPCGFPEPTISLEEDCGVFNIVVGTIDESGASGNGTVVTYDTAFADPWTSTTAVTGVEGLTADGTTQIWINIADSDDATCNDTFGPFTAPFGEVPDCDKGGSFPANPGN